jgi:hypothetical protein
MSTQSTPITQEQAKAIMALADIIVETAKEARETGGAPSGPMYAAMSAHGVSLEAYQQILDVLVKIGKVRVVNHCVLAVED